MLIVIIFLIITMVGVSIRNSIDVVQAFDDNMTLRCANPFGDGYYNVSKSRDWYITKTGSDVEFKYGVVSINKANCYYRKEYQIQKREKRK